MASNTPRPLRPLAFVAAVVIALYAGVIFAVPSHTPELGLDLRGGTSVTFKPDLPSGKVPSKADLDKAVEIMRQRVDGLGVSSASVQTEGSNIVISVPGKGRSDILATVGRTALLRFRQVLQSGVWTGTSTTPTALPSVVPTGSGGPTSSQASPSPSPSASGPVVLPSSVPTSIAPASSASADGRALSGALLAGSATPSPSLTTSPTHGVSAATATPTVSAAPTLTTTPSPTTSTSSTTPTPTALAEYQTINCSKVVTSKQVGADNPDSQLVTCGVQSGAIFKYLLANAEVEGTQVKKVTAEPNPSGTSDWVVNVTFNSSGTAAFAALTTRVQPLTAPENQVAITLDGVVQSAVTVQSPITNGQAQISGNFTQSQADQLVNLLAYGALPLSFSVLTSQSISATLGTNQLQAGLIAGAIGLGLVILFCLVYYRGLGLVAVASLLLSGLILYAATTLLGKAIGYTLSLAGIAGFIVAVGITADSFVVFFERLRDEIREGRSLRSSVERAWVRARRTIVSADTVSLIAAVTLYLVSVGDVRGFAFTLGLSTLSDLFIVFLFTKPLITLLARTRTFGSGSRFSGLSADRIGHAIPDPHAASEEAPVGA